MLVYCMHRTHLTLLFYLYKNKSEEETNEKYEKIVEYMSAYQTEIESQKNELEIGNTGKQLVAFAWYHSYML